MDRLWRMWLTCREFKPPPKPSAKLSPASSPRSRARLRAFMERVRRFGLLRITRGRRQAKPSASSPSICNTEENCHGKKEDSDARRRLRGRLRSHGALSDAADDRP